MPKSKMSADMVANHFVSYICETQYAKHRHVRQVASWLGFTICGIEEIADDWGLLHKRQFWFKIGDRVHKLRYAHDVGPRGGLQIVEMVSGREDGKVRAEIHSLSDAEAFYNRPGLTLAQAAFGDAVEDAAG